MVYEVVIEERRTYVIMAEGNSVRDARQDALESYCRLKKSGELIPHKVSKPKILVTEARKTASSDNF